MVVLRIINQELAGSIPLANFLRLTVREWPKRIAES